MIVNEAIALETAPSLTAEPGGNDPHRFDVREAWYPVFYLQDLDPSKIMKFTLLGVDLAIWWDKTGQSWRAFADQCPHRLAPLSEGRINEKGWLECPYHGWAFSATGKCETIPQQNQGGKAEQSERACVRNFPTAEHQGLLFVYAGNPENAAQTKVPLIDPLEESPEKWVCLNTFRDLPYDALTLLENVLDASHIPYTHHRTVGNRANASKVDLEVIAAGKQGFQGFWEEGPRKGTLGSQQTHFIAPGLMWHDLTSQQFGRTMTVVYATPIRKGECRLFARFPFQFASKVPATFIKLTPQWYSHIGQNAILEDDQIFLYHQERYLEAAGGSEKVAKAFYLPTKADLFVLAFRNWVNEYDADPFPGESFPPLRSREELLDRYHSHTIHCRSCSTALRRIQKLREIAAILAAIAWITAPLLTVIASENTVPTVAISTGITLVLSALWWGLGKLERRFYEGRDIPPRNLPEKKK